jgi:hypothetical protein
MRTLHGSKLRQLANFAFFQKGWFACVLGAASGGLMLGVGMGVALLVVVLHVAMAKHPAAEFELVMSAVLLGLVWETAMIQSGLLSVPHGDLFVGMAPPWMVVMWALFATTLNVSLGWLQGRWVLTVVLGAMAGPLSYWAGVRMGAVQFVEPAQAVAALAVGWGLATPLLLLLARLFNADVANRAAAVDASADGHADMVDTTRQYRL